MTIKQSVTLILGLALFTGSGLLTSCDEKTDLNSYYLPATELDSPLILEYSLSGSREGSEYWQLIRRGDTALIDFLGKEGRIEQRSVEFMGSDGVIQTELTLIPIDSVGNSVHAYPEILYDDLFPFDPLDSLHVYLHKIRWEEDNYTKELIRNRRFFGFERIETAVGAFPAAKFKVDELYRDEEEGFLELHFEGWEYYAKDKGLVLKTRSLGEKLSERKELVGIYRDKVATEFLNKGKNRAH